MNIGTPILHYHRVGPRDGSRMDRYTVSPGSFRTQMEYLARGGWNVISLEEHFSKQPAAHPRRSVVITFDDGFASNREHAWPILEQMGLASTTFVVTGQVGGTNAWDDDAMPRYPLLTESDIRSADPALMAFQSHAATHRSLPGLGAEQVRRELSESKSALEDLTGRPVFAFAYPCGAWNAAVKRMVGEAGYHRACSCIGGLNRDGTDPLLLRRVEMLEKDVGLRLRMKLSTGVNFG